MKDFLAKIWKGIKVVIARFKSPVVWAGIFAVVTLIFQVAKVDPSQITSWKLLWEFLGTVLSNPYTIGSIIIAIFAFINNADSQKNF